MEIIIPYKVIVKITRRQYVWLSWTTQSNTHTKQLASRSILLVCLAEILKFTSEFRFRQNPTATLASAQHAAVSRATKTVEEEEGMQGYQD